VQQTQTGSDVWTIPADGNGAPREFLTSPAVEGGEDFSPDGRWVLYLSDESGRDELYAALYASPSARFQISEEGARAGRWVPDGRSVIYATLDGHLKRVPVDGAGERLVLGASEVIFGGRTVPGSGDISPDGKRFLIAVPEGGGDTTLHLVTDWRALMKARAADR
jgi:Tol biopolymer transport system component